MAKICIIGLGWLGEPLALHLKKLEHTVVGSTTTEAKIDYFKTLSIAAYYFKLTENGVEGDAALLLNNIDFLVVAVPPKLRGTNKESFVAKIKFLQKEMEFFKVPKLIFVSSTSVYGDAQGEVSERTIPKPDTESGWQLWEIEQLLTNKNTTIVRFGGLIGSNRNPVKMLTGKTNVSKPNAVVNLISQNNCIDVISKIIEDGFYGKTFNAVNPCHPTREEYYLEKAKQYGITPPFFNKKDVQKGKQIGSMYTDFFKDIAFENLI